MIVYHENYNQDHLLKFEKLEMNSVIKLQKVLKTNGWKDLSTEKSSPEILTFECASQ